MDVFLSASVPLPNRDKRFFSTADIVAIRDAVKSLAVEVGRNGSITFGGHPAITPLIALVLKQTFPANRNHFVLYQSEYFLQFFPKENNDFIDVRVIHAVDNDREKSLKLMREEMIKSCDYDAGIFIGGMDGVVDEFNLFRNTHPAKPCYPIASTGGAALEIFDKGKWDNRSSTS